MTTNKNIKEDLKDKSKGPQPISIEEYRRRNNNKGVVTFRKRKEIQRRKIGEIEKAAR